MECSTTAIGLPFLNAVSLGACISTIKVRACLFVVIMQRQSNLESPTSSPMDFETFWGLEMGTRYTYQWDDEQLRLVQAYRVYHHEMACFIENPEREEPEGKVLSYKPKANLKYLLAKTKRHQNNFQARAFMNIWFRKLFQITRSTVQPVSMQTSSQSLKACCLISKQAKEYTK